LGLGGYWTEEIVVLEQRKYSFCKQVKLTNETYLLQKEMIHVENISWFQ
jgi:hypothetical protein